LVGAAEEALGFTVTCRPFGPGTLKLDMQRTQGLLAKPRGALGDHLSPLRG